MTMTLTNDAAESLVHNIEFDMKVSNKTDIALVKQYVNLITAETLCNVISFVSDIACEERKNRANEDVIATLRDISEELQRTFKSVNGEEISNA